MKPLIPRTFILFPLANSYSDGCSQFMASFTYLTLLICFNKHGIPKNVLSRNAF